MLPWIKADKLLNSLQWLRTALTCCNSWRKTKLMIIELHTHPSKSVRNHQNCVFPHSSHRRKWHTWYQKSTLNLVGWLYSLIVLFPLQRAILWGFFHPFLFFVFSPSIWLFWHPSPCDPVPTLSDAQTVGSKTSAIKANRFPHFTLWYFFFFWLQSSQWFGRQEHRFCTLQLIFKATSVVPRAF